MRKLAKYLFFIITLFVAGNTQAQDALFSQMNKNNALLNPSLLSAQNDPLEIGLNYREQGASVSNGLPIRTFQVIANFKSKSFKEDQFTYGLSVLSDRGGTGHIGSNLAHLNVAYLKKLTGKYSKIGAHYIGIGSTLGMGQKSVGWNRFWFGNQFNNEYHFIDETVDPREDDIIANLKGQSKIFTDVNAGLMWYANLREGLALDLGFSIYHLTRPNISLFKNGNETQSLRYNFHGSLYSKISELLTLKPSVIFISQGISRQLLFGSELGMDNNDGNEFTLQLGVFGRMVSNVNNIGMESIICTLNTEYNQYRFGIAYDITISSLSKYNKGYGAWEFRLGYALSSKKENISNRNAKQFKL